jgi:hypothetical protein
MSGIAAIGNTPVVQLERLVDDDCAEVWAKLEAANPTGSYKDRMALAMIEAAERDGRLQPGQTVVECTGGSTGSSLAFVCAVKDYPLRIVSSDAFAKEKILTMLAFGADVELIPSPAGITPDLVPAMIRRAGEIAAEVGGYWTNQFQNDDMIDGTAGSDKNCSSSFPARPPSMRCAATWERRGASWAPPGRCASGCRRSRGWRWNQRSRRCCRVVRPAPITSRAVGSGPGRRS